MEMLLCFRRTPTRTMAVELLEERMTDLADQVTQTSSQMTKMMQMMQMVIAQQRHSTSLLEITEVPLDD